MHHEDTKDTKFGNLFSFFFFVIFVPSVVKFFFPDLASLRLCGR